MSVITVHTAKGVGKIEFEGNPILIELLAMYGIASSLLLLHISIKESPRLLTYARDSFVGRLFIIPSFTVIPPKI